MNRRPHTTTAILAALGLVVGALWTGITQAEETAKTKSPAYTEHGADSCIKCHDELSEYPVFDIFKTKHAVMGDKRTPMARLQCETCHGPGSLHADMSIKEGEKRPRVRAFGRGSPTPVAEQNGVCLGCHDNHERANWKGSIHQSEEVACADCHTIHTARDHVLTVREQPAVCYRCHPRQRAETYLASTHPLRYGQMACSDCHDVHDASLGPNLLKRPTINETCYQCHAEKRGPFLWEHAPVTEDCTLCHLPHGSNHPDLLTRSPTLLCQQCHSQAGHPSVSYTRDGLPGGAPSAFLLGKSCLNCHSEIHGSNHPSGIRLSR